MVRIEFTGLPGSGKSTLFPVVKQALLGQGMMVYDQKDVFREYVVREGIGKLVDLVVPSERLKTKLAVKLYRSSNIFREQVDSIKAYPELFQAFLRISNGRDVSRTDAHDVMTWFLTTLGCQHVAGKILSSSDFLMMNEGFFHKLINLFVVEKKCTYNIEDIQSYLQLIPELDCLIKIDVKSEVSLARIKTRGSSLRFDNLSDDAFLGLLNDMNTMLEDAISLLEYRGTKVVRIKNTDSIEQMNSKINASVNGLLKSIGRGSYTANTFAIN